MHLDDQQKEIVALRESGGTLSLIIRGPRTPASALHLPKGASEFNRGPVYQGPDVYEGAEEMSFDEALRIVEEEMAKRGDA